MKISLEKYDFMEGLRDDVEFLLEEQKIAILEEILTIMEKQNVSRADLARKLKTSRAYITKLFRTDVNFTLRSMVQIAHALNTRVSCHFHGREARTEWLDIYPQVASMKSVESTIWQWTDESSVSAIQQEEVGNERSTIAA